MKKNNTESNKTNGRFYIVFQCRKSHELRGRKYDGGCNRFSIRSCRVVPTKKQQMQGVCGHCKRRPRIDPTTIDESHIFDNLKDAINMLHRLEEKRIKENKGEK